MDNAADKNPQGANDQQENTENQAPSNADGLVAPIVIAKPVAGDMSEIVLQPGQKYLLDFEESEVTSMTQQGSDLTIAFTDGQSIILKNFAEATSGDSPAVLSLQGELNGGQLTDLIQVVETTPSEDELEDPQADIRESGDGEEQASGDDTSGEDVAQIQPAAGEPTAEQVAQIEPAAGDDAGDSGRGGFGFQSGFSAGPIDPLVDVGAIDPTLLNYGVDFRQDDNFPQISIDGVPNISDNPELGAGIENVDETDGFDTVSGTIVRTFGTDGAGTFGGSGTFSSTETLTSHGVPVDVAFDEGTQTYTGTAGGNTVFTLVIADDNSGDYTFTQFAPLDHPDAGDHDDVITLAFGIEIFDVDRDRDTGDITINIFDDGPSIVADSRSIDETDLGPVSVTGDLTENFGQDGAGNIHTNGDFNASGSLLDGTLTSGGFPITVTSTANGYVGVVNGPVDQDGFTPGATIFELTLNQNTGEYEFTLHGSLDHADPNNPDDIITLNFGAEIVDYDGDTASTTITINVADDVPTIIPPVIPPITTPQGDNPDVGNGYEIVDETGGLDTVNGTVNFNFGNDGAGSLNGVGTSTSSVPLVSHGVPVDVAFDANTGTYTGTAGGFTVFTLSIDTNGEYEFTQYLQLDHPIAGPDVVTDHDDVIRLEFDIVAQDADGDTATGSIIIDVRDDGPSIQTRVGGVREGDLSPGNPVVVTRTMNHDFGADGEGDIHLTGTFMATFQVGGQAQTLTSGGEEITVVETANGYIGTINGGATTVFTLDVNPANGTHTYTQHLGIDHPGAGADVIWLKFGVEIVDYDGDTATAMIVVDLHDDVPSFGGNPQIGAGIETVDETDLGPVVVDGALDIDFGADGAGELSTNGEFDVTGSVLNNTLTSGGHPVTVTNTPDGYVGTANGETIFELTLNQETGEYEFTLIGTLDHADGTDHNDVITLEFGVEIEDSDGDTDTGSIVVNVADDGPVIHDRWGGISESGLKDGPITLTRTMNHDFGSDGEGNIHPTGNFMATFQVGGQAQTLTSDGQPVTVTQTANGYIGTINGGATTVFTLDVNPANGTHTYTQFVGIDHPGAGNDVIWLKFEVEIIDADGDTDIAIIGVDLHDSGPQISDEPQIGAGIETVDETDLGPVVVDGALDIDFGADGAGELSTNGSFSFTGSVLNNALTSGGHPVTVTNTPSGYVGTANGETIFELTLNQDTGAYEFTLIGTLDHADNTDHNDVLTLEFGVQIADADGDTDTGSIVVNVADDGPVIHDRWGGISESGLKDGPITLTRTMNHDFGSDGEGNIHPTGNFMATFQVGGQAQTLTSDGQPVTVTQTANGYIGTINGGATTVFTLDVNPANGTHTYTQFVGIDHPGAGNDVIWLKFEVEIIDADGDTDIAIIGVDLHDSGPQISDEPQIGAGIETVDETDLGPVVVDGALDIDFGADGAGELSTNGSFSFTGSVLNNALTSGGHPVTVTNTPSGYVGTANGETIFELTLNQDTGAYEFTLIGTLDHADNTDHNDVLTLEFGVQIADADGDTDTGSIVVNVADDGPSIATRAGRIDETGLANGPITVTRTLAHDFGADGAGTIEPTGNYSVRFFSGGPFAVDEQLTSGGVNVDISATADGYIGVIGNETIFTLTIDPTNGTHTYTQFAALDHPKPNNGDEPMWLKFEVQIIDADGDTDTGYIILDVEDDAPTAIDAEDLVVDETDANPVDTDDGVATGNFGADEPGTFSGNGQVAGDVLTSGGTPVVVTYDAATATYTGTANGADIFTFAITEDGSYEYTLIGALDHPDTADHNDTLDIVFGITGTDSDGDSVDSTVNVRVFDDGPSITTRAGRVDETNLDNGPISVTRTMTHDFGQDGEGEITGNGVFMTLFQVGGHNQPLTSGGVLVNVTQTANGYIGIAGGETVFTLTIDSSNGTHTYEQFTTIDHPNENNPNDVIWLKFGVDITDGDGDSASAFIQIDVQDDGVVANDDVREFSVVDGGTSGDVTVNDDLSNDEPNSVTSVSFGGGDQATVIQVPANGSNTIDGEFGTLEMFSDGTYNYTLFDQPETNVTGGRQNVYSFNKNFPGGGAAAGDVQNINGSYNDVTDEFTFNFTIAGTSANGYVLAINDGPNSKNITGEMAQIYFDASGDGVPVVSIYGYNGNSTATYNSYADGNHFVAGTQAPDRIATSLEGDNPFTNIDVSVDANGNQVFSLSMDASIIVDHIDSEDWTGVAFDDLVGMWFQPMSGVSTAYNDDGYLESWNYSARSWHDSSNNPTQVTEICETVHSNTLSNGEINEATTTYNNTTHEFTFTTVISDPATQGFTLAVNDGPNPKGHPGEMPIFYFDASGAGTPIVTAYGYNGLNNFSSFYDGDSATAGHQTSDLIASSQFGDSPFTNISSTINADGHTVFTFTLDATEMQLHNPAYGPDGIWNGVAFDDAFGIWFHTMNGLNTNYDADGALTQWSFSDQSWIDASNRPTETTELCGCEKRLDPSAADVAGRQASFTNDGITISVVNQGNFDIVWRDEAHTGSGLGIDNLNTGDHHRVWPLGETFGIALDEQAESVTITIAELGSNNNNGRYGADFRVELADGTFVVGEQQFVPSQINGGLFEFTLEAADYGQPIVGLTLNSTNAGQFWGASFLLNNVVAECVVHEPTDTTDTFTYTLVDADGDNDTATLTLNGDVDGDSLLAAGPPPLLPVFGPVLGPEIFEALAVNDGQEPVPFAADNVIDFGVDNGVQDAIDNFVIENGEEAAVVEAQAVAAPVNAAFAAANDLAPVAQQDLVDVI